MLFRLRFNNLFYHKQQGLLFIIFLLCHLSFLAGILTFSTIHLDLTLVRAMASYLYEGFKAVAIEPFAADCGRVSAIGCESWFLCVGLRPKWDSNRV